MLTFYLNMAHPKQLVKVKLISGIFYRDIDTYEQVKQKLVEEFGEIDFESSEYDFNEFTDYYEKEMGTCLKKRIISFHQLIDRDILADIKENIEDSFSTNNNRDINIDTGYLTQHNIVLASAKQMPHKVSIGKGYFGDVVLTYSNNNYYHYFKTFMDHKSDKVKDIYKKIRQIYIKQIK